MRTRRDLLVLLVLASACSRSAQSGAPSATEAATSPVAAPTASPTTAPPEAVAAASAALPPPPPAQAAAAPRGGAAALARPSRARSAGPADDIASGAFGAVAKEEAAADKKKDGADEKPNAPQTWKRAGSATHAARVAIGDREQLPIRGMQFKIDVDGFRARVVLDAYFDNDKGGQYEGNFQLRLPDEATPYFFAFGETAWQKREVAPGSDFERAAFFPAAAQRTMGTTPELLMAARASSWRAPKEARIVPKEKAAFAFTETERRQVDPALLEWAGAGVFNARVFPIAPNKTHRVVLGYDVNLVRVGDDFEYKLDLPDGVADLAVDVSSAGTPRVEPAVGVTSEGGRSYVHLVNTKERTLTFRFPKAGNPVLVGDDAKLGAKRFAANVVVDVPSRATSSHDRAVFLVDTSLSSNPDRFNVFLKLLRANLTNNRATLKRFNVVFFNVETQWWKQAWVDNTPENVDALMADANKLALEGATDLASAFAQAETPSWLAGEGPWDLFLLSDGAATWGESDKNAIARVLTQSARGPLFAYNTGIAGTDSEALSFLARETGGAVFSVVGESEIAAASTAHRVRPYKLVAVKGTGADDVIVAGRPRAIYPGQALFVAGRGVPTDLAFTLEQDGKQIVVRPTLARATESPLAARAYGQIATRALEEFGPATEALAKSYAIHHRVTGETCSLVMLEREEDYQRFGIKPENEAATVRESLATTTLARVEREIENSLSDPKARVTRWLDGLKNAPGVHIQLSSDFLAAVGAMPPSSFAVAMRPLTVQMHDKSLLSGDLREKLTMPGRLEYDPISLEAAARRQRYGAGDALKALSSLVEQSPGDAILARDVGFSATQMGLPDQGFFLFRRVADARPWEPQSYRAMADVLTRMGNVDLAMVYYEVALQGAWDGRFGEFHRIAAVDYVRFLRRIKSGELKTSVPEFAAQRLGAVSEEVNLRGADLVVMITWNTDNSDVDLHVTEPSGEECFYSNRNTRLGGELTQDVTQGYGPEMYVMKHAAKGSYAIRAHYFAQQRNRASARTKVYATVIENWGTPAERTTEKVVTLEEGKEMHDVLRVERGRTQG